MFEDVLRYARPVIDTERCWRWPGFHRKSDGRPVLSGQYVYRMIYEAATGEPCPPLSAHHRCRNSWCINPWHLEPLTQGEHLTEHGLSGDWGQALKTHCPQNHPYDAENTYTWVRKRKGKLITERQCRICRRESTKRWKAKKETS
jgi:hypothetical protein